MTTAIIKEKAGNALVAILEGIDGKFGCKVLKPKYRKIWRWITYPTLIIMFFKFIFIPFMEWWDGVVAFLNWWRWGI